MRGQAGALARRRTVDRGASMPGGKPNGVIILSDDVGWFDVGCCHQGMVCAPTANVDRIAAEGVCLTDCSAQASCTAGRAAWSYVPGASWKRPGGPGSSVSGRDHHPLVHIAYEDAEAYAAGSASSSPTEDEWGFAARGGLEAAVFAWGDEDFPHGRTRRRHPRRGDQGRLPPLRAELLPPVPSCGSPAQMIDTSMSHLGFRCIARPGTTEPTPAGMNRTVGTGTRPHPDPPHQEGGQA